MGSVRRLLSYAALGALALAGCGTPTAQPSSSVPPQISAAASTQSAGSAAKPSGATKFVLGHSQITGNALASWAAEDGEYYKRNGLDVDAQLMSGGTKTIASLLAGQIQVVEV